jgi:hypothetical protein
MSFSVFVFPAKLLFAMPKIPKVVFAFKFTASLLFVSLHFFLFSWVRVTNILVIEPTVNSFLDSPVQI